uniref:Uncharacterized protein n=1 Tax=Bionectria ochroleuca TaxID=29856 RepID=A0A8H7K704_BIOOC
MINGRTLLEVCLSSSLGRVRSLKTKIFVSWLFKDGSNHFQNLTDVLFRNSFMLEAAFLPTSNAGEGQPQRRALKVGKAAAHANCALRKNHGKNVHLLSWNVGFFMVLSLSQ